MELFSPEFFSALLAIIIIDLVLAGDNAVVIALAARSLPPHLQTKAIFWGTAGAIIVRTLLTFVAVSLLKIPGLLLVGGLALVWIAYKLLTPGNSDGHANVSAVTLRQALQTIIIADAVMGVDNVLAVAGAAHGSFVLVVLGLLISVPIVVWGSRLILRWVERFPIIIYIGAGVLLWTAAKMITSEMWLKDYFTAHPQFKFALDASLVVAVILAGYVRRTGPANAWLWISLAVILFWFGVFGLIENAVSFNEHDRPFENWEWPYQMLDLIADVGWIPIVAWLFARGRRPAHRV